MKIKHLSDWMHVVGTFGVIASLLFVGLQMRQADKIAVAEMHQARFSLKQQNFLVELESPELRLANARLLNCETDFSPADRFALEASWNAWFIYWENNVYQHQQGLLDRASFNKTKNSIEMFVRRPLIRDWWDRGRGYWSGEFVELVDQAFTSAVPISCARPAVIDPEAADIPDAVLETAP